MDSSTSFDLDSTIFSWRRELRSSGAVDDAAADELESHLRDAVAALARAGLSCEEAFFVARRRLGPTAALQAEFDRLNPDRIWIERALWMVAGVLMLGLVTAVGRGVAVGLAFVGIKWMPGQSLLGPSILAATLQVSATLGALALAWRWLTSQERGGGPRWRWWQARPALAAVAVCLLQVFGLVVSLSMTMVGYVTMSPETMARYSSSLSIAQFVAVGVILPAAVYVVLARRRAPDLVV